MGFTPEKIENNDKNGQHNTEKEAESDAQILNLIYKLYLYQISVTNTYNCMKLIKFLFLKFHITLNNVL